MSDLTEQPKNKLPRAEVSSSGLNYKEIDIENGLNPGWLYKLAFTQPNVKVNRYFEENGYEYEMFAIWNPETRIMETTLPCTHSPWHHIFQTCKVCGQKG